MNFFIIFLQKKKFSKLKRAKGFWNDILMEKNEMLVKVQRETCPIVSQNENQCRESTLRVKGFIYAEYRNMLYLVRIYDVLSSLYEYLHDSDSE